MGRKNLNCRFACICTSEKQAVERLNQLDDQEILELDKDVLNHFGKKNYNEIYFAAKNWLHGETISWRTLYTTLPYRLPLPTYPFESREFWVMPPASLPNNTQPIKTSRISTKILESKIKDILKHFLGSDIINSTDDFYDLGGDSLLMLQVTAKIEKEMGISIPANIISKYSCAKNLAQYIQTQLK